MTEQIGTSGLIAGHKARLRLYMSVRRSVDVCVLNQIEDLVYRSLYWPAVLDIIDQWQDAR